MSTSINIKGFVEEYPQFIQIPDGGTVVEFSVLVPSAEKDGIAKGFRFDVEARNELGDPVYDCVQQGYEIEINGWLTMDRYIDEKGERITKPTINMHSFKLNGDAETNKYIEQVQIEAHRMILGRALKK